jgi:hypothetical protein
MATVEECRAALERLASRMADNAAAARQRLTMDRPFACRVTDLGAAFHGRLLDGQILDLCDGDDPSAKISLITSSDDLIALVDGQLSPAAAWASGRVKLHAGMLDLMKFRRLL